MSSVMSSSSLLRKSHIAHASHFGLILYLMQKHPIARLEFLDLVVGFVVGFQKL
jgi:hypothetical protein